MSIINRWLDIIRQRVFQEFAHPISVCSQLLKTNAFLYPFKGMLFLRSNLKKMLPIFLPTLVPLGILQCFIYVFLFSTILPFNLFICTIFSGPLGFEMGVINTLQYCNWINNFVLRILLKKKLMKVFNLTLSLTGNDGVALSDERKKLAEEDQMTELTSANFFSLVSALGWISHRLLLNFIPIAGTFLNAYSSSIAYTKTSQAQFYKLNKLRPAQVKYLVKENEAKYLSFGLVGQLLESIPFLGVLFCFTNCIGAALMSSDQLKEGSEDKKDTSRGNVHYAAET